MSFVQRLPPPMISDSLALTGSSCTSHQKSDPETTHITYTHPPGPTGLHVDCVFPELPVELLELFRCFVTLALPTFIFTPAPIPNPIPAFVSLRSAVLLLILPSPYPAPYTSSGLVVPLKNAENGRALDDGDFTRLNPGHSPAPVSEPPVKVRLCLCFKSEVVADSAGNSSRLLMFVHRSSSSSSSSGPGKRQPPTPSKSLAKGVVG